MVPNLACKVTIFIIMINVSNKCQLSVCTYLMRLESSKPTMYKPGSTQCLTSCKLLVFSRFGSITLLICLVSLMISSMLHTTSPTPATTRIGPRIIKRPTYRKSRLKRNYISIKHIQIIITKYPEFWVGSALLVKTKAYTLKA